MPNIKNFSTLENIKQVEIFPVGWIHPVIIEYGIYKSVPSYYYWRVKGATHTWEIAVTRLDFLSKGDYKTHFINALESFRDEYLIWATQNFYIPWQQEYYNQFNK